MSTKFQIVVTVEFDQDALRWTYRPALAPPTGQVLLEDINRELRLWAGSNPYALQDPGHLTVRMALANTAAAPGGASLTVEAALEKVASDLDGHGDDLKTLARLCRAAA